MTKSRMLLAFKNGKKKTLFSYFLESLLRDHIHYISFYEKY